MRGLALILAMAIPSGASAEQANSVADAARVYCQGIGTWAPVRLPPAGINLFIPCNDDEMNAFKNANETRKKTDGLAGCERDGKKFLVVYLVNTPDGFFDGFVSRNKSETVGQFNFGQHRVVRTLKVVDGDKDGDSLIQEANQLIEVDAKRAVLVSVSSKSSTGGEFTKLSSCVFNALEFIKS